MTNEVFIDDATLDEIETCAKDAVRKVGRLLAHRFGTDLEVKFKDKSETDPVTDVENESQAYMWRPFILKYYESHFDIFHG